MDYEPLVPITLFLWQKHQRKLRGFWVPSMLVMLQNEKLKSGLPIHIVEVEEVVKEIYEKQSAEVVLGVQKKNELLSFTTV